METDKGILVPIKFLNKGIRFRQESNEYSSNIERNGIFTLQIALDEYIDDYYREYIKLQGVF
eukprot:CAMPEP_0170525988 /NCGR_PEP_ID=MMETSP0209-20121228/11446_1 /TAXON_ID=665100 ORGANISM="Litonotus pictus, Strain P1" /NCGR_SAMPLE_ID=MMETSP0209 /ASSEMBLY_ACC=CAM_ASM_000301 /LENGTH=61 /DNA_ID=CAMNT_0010815567 /DNA_START=29 /DNA_END=211 /DNA_ORIENTATION=-